MERVVLQTDWDIKPMPERHEEFILKRDMSMEELEILKRGHIPEQMEDKWFWYYQDGILYAHRSWTGFCVYMVKIDFERCEHRVIVNRDDSQYAEKSIEADKVKLNELLDWWSQPQYDFYNQWISETCNNLTKTIVPDQEKSRETIFEIFGIENKELQVSNLFAYYFDLNRNGHIARDFLNAFLRLVNKDPVEMEEQYVVKREYPLKYKGCNNIVDILIIVGEEDNPKRLICIENKIKSKEGPQQTRQYYEALEYIFGECHKKDYIYMTKNNSSVALSSKMFCHIRYREVAELLMYDEFCDMRYAEDFCEYYVFREERIFAEIEENDKIFDKNDSEDFSMLLDYIVWKINASNESLEYKNIFCQKDISARSAQQFFQAYVMSWFFELTVGDCVKPISIHLEGYENAVALHMEIAPYEQFSKIRERYGERFFISYVNLRDLLRSKMVFADKSGYHGEKLSWNADLSIAKFRIEADTYKKYFDAIISLIREVDDILNEIKGAKDVGRKIDLTGMKIADSNTERE